MKPELDLALLAPPPGLTLQESAPAGEATTRAPDGAGTDGTQTAPSPWNSLLFPMLLVFAIFYFVMIGPERKARRKREAMLGALKKGDKVLTNGGMFATVAAIQDDVVTLQIDDGVRVRFSRASIQSVLETEGQAAPAGK
jgi:preprotein translocase subunit YajC